MSAAVACGKRSSSFFEDLTHSPPAAKRARCGGSASPPSPAWPRAAADPALAADLSARFPAMSPELIEKALEASGNDLDSAIKSLLNLHLESVGNSGDPAYVSLNQVTTEVQGSAECVSDVIGVGAPSESVPRSENLPSDGSEWVDLLVNEMSSASNMDDAKARASRALEVFEKSVISRVNAQAPHGFQKENAVLKGQLESVIRENTVLKRLFAKQHERQKDYDEKNQELQQLKQLIPQYQEQVSNLEVNNYALNMHLRQAQQGSSIPGRFHPDIF